MRILFISHELGAAELALQLQKEGNDVSLYVDDSAVAESFDGIVEKTKNWKQKLSWVGKTGLIIFDDVGYGVAQDTLRRKGYRVVGGSQLGDRLEEDREFANSILKKHGIQTLESHNFSRVSSAIAFVKKQKGRYWVVKKNGGHSSSLCYVGTKSDSSDVLGILEGYRNSGVKHINLQERANGIEVGVARYFNGYDWVGPIEMNVEHKGMMNGNIGPKTAEMGTLMWYDANTKNKLFQKTLARLKAYLREINFRGDIDVDCIVDGKHIWPLELTTRFGNPATALQMELHQSPWTEFLSAVADGKDFDLQYRTGFGVIVTLAVPPFPYIMNGATAEGAKGLPVIFDEHLLEKDRSHYFFEEIKKAGDGLYYVSGTRGCVMHVAGYGSSIRRARKEAYKNLSRVVVPKMFFRTDIGESFEKNDLYKLRQWGWLE